MRRAKTVLNLPIINLAEGKVIGRVRDLVLDTSARRVAGFLVRGFGPFSDALVVPIERVRAIGQDAITVASAEALLPSQKVKPLRTLLKSGVKLVGLRMITEGGRELGTIEDIFIGPGGDVVGYELNPGAVEGTISGRRFVSGEQVLAAGRDAAIVPDRVERLITLPESFLGFPPEEETEKTDSTAIGSVGEVPANGKGDYPPSRAA